MSNIVVIKLHVYEVMAKHIPIPKDEKIRKGKDFDDEKGEYFLLKSKYNFKLQSLIQNC